MIRMTAEIELLEGSGEIQTNSISITPDGNNISADIVDVVSVRRAGSDPFLFGVSTLGSGATFSSGENYFIGSEMSDENGDFATPYVLTLSILCEQEAGTTISPNFSIVFDTVHNAYPSSITVAWDSGTSQGSSTTAILSPYFVFNTDEEITLGQNRIISFTVTMSDWSAPKYPLRIQGIDTGLYLYFDRRNLISLSTPIKDRSDNEQPSYGLISNEGEMTVIDTTLEIKEYARMKILKPDLDVQIWLEDTITKKKQSIGKFKTNKWSYNNQNFEVTIQLKDDLEELQNINANEKITRTLSLNSSIFDLYSTLLDLTPTKYNIEEISSDNINYLKNIIIPYYFIDDGSIWEQWNKFCNITGAHLYKKMKTTFFNNGADSIEENIIKIDIDFS